MKNKDFTLYIIPGLAQLYNKKFYHGFFIMFIILSSALYYIHLMVYNSELVFYDQLFMVALFFSAIILHFLYVVRLHTSNDIFNESYTELYEKARLAFLKQNYDLAKIYYEALYKRNSKEEDVIYQLGRTYIELGEIKKTLKIYKKYLAMKKKKWRREIEDLYEEYKIR